MKNNFNQIIMRKKVRRGITVGFAVFFFALFLSFSASTSFMAVDGSYAKEISATVRATGYNISLASTGRISLNLNAAPEGTVAVAEDTVKVLSNSGTGYKLYVSMATSDENGNRLNLDGQKDAQHYIAPTSGTLSEPKALDTNTWGFAVPGLTGFDSSYDPELPNTSTKFASVPLRGNEVLISSLDTVTPAEGNEMRVYYGVKGNTALAAGTYSNAIVYSTVVNSSSPDVRLVSSSPNVTEKLNGGELLTIATGNTAVAESIVAAAIAADVAPAEVLVGGSACSNVQLSNNESFLNITCLTPAHDSGVYDIAVTIPVEEYYKEYFLESAIEYKAIPSMQNMKVAQAAGMKTGETIELMDERDGKKYFVTKEADGNLWMTQNLDLDLAIQDNVMGTTKSGQFVAFTSENTDISGENWTIPEGSAGYDTQTATGTPWDAYGRNGGTSGTYEVRSYDPGDKCRTYSTRTGTDPESNTTSGCTSSLAGADHDHVGNYYNWPAATAGTGTFDDKAQYTNVEDSICPSGWKLPTGLQSNTANNEWNTLLNKVNSSISFTTSYISNTDPIMASLMNDNGADNSSIWLTRAGFYDYSNGSMDYLGAYGYYWSRSVNSDSLAYYLVFRSSYVYPGTNINNKGFGFSVRCMAEIPEPIPTMQDAKLEDYTDAAVGTTVALMDERDGKYYYVTKEADGHLWMTQNLDLDLHVNDCSNTHQTTLTTGTMGTCKNGTFVPFTKDNTDISEDRGSWTIVSDGSEDNAGYDTQTATGTQWNQFGSNNGTNYTTGKDNAYEVRSYDPGDKCRTYSTRTGTDPESNTTSGCTSSLAGADHDHVGNYYNWPAATAGTGTFDDKTQYANVEDSICPSGWKLPTGRQSNTADNEWNVLLNKVNSSISFTTSSISNTDPIMASLMNDNGANNSSVWLTRAGFYNYSNGSMYYLGTYGFYWSRSVSSGNSAYNLYFDSSRVYPGTSNSNKGYGFSVRCRL